MDDASGGPSVALIETALPDSDESRSLVRALVGERIAACANWRTVHSVYWWRGAIEEADEILVSFKTTQSKQGELMRALGSRHPYDVPYIAAMPVHDVASGYASWVEDETSVAEGGGPPSKSRPTSV